MSEEAPPRKRGRPSTMRAEGVTDVAVEAYRRSDPADVSVNAVCRLAGVSKPSLYREFGSEDGLTKAALDRYAATVLQGMFDMLSEGRGLGPTLDALIAFASEDPSMETGCLFYKMRAGKHRLGPMTRARVEEIDAMAREGFAAFLQGAQARGELSDRIPVETGARYLAEQIALALIQRAAGEDKAAIRATLELALGVFGRP
ncbi:MAG: TetR/AcrR family transcriptional regulator [Pseudomonadota bacterium]